MIFKHTHIRIAAASCALAVLACELVGCASMGLVAPIVTPSMADAAAGVSVATLEGGRRTYVTNCTACHHAEPVTKYSPAEWRGIVADMSPRAKLDAARESALLGYLLAARASVARLPAP